MYNNLAVHAARYLNDEIRRSAESHGPIRWRVVSDDPVTAVELLTEAGTPEARSARANPSSSSSASWTSTSSIALARQHPVQGLAHPLRYRLPGTGTAVQRGSGVVGAVPGSRRQARPRTVRSRGSVDSRSPPIPIACPVTPAAASDAR